MGTSHRIYKLRREGYTIAEAIDIIKRLNDSLCIGREKRFLYEFNVTEIKRFNEIRQKFKTLENSLVQFETKDSLLLKDILLEPELYSSAYYYKSKLCNDGSTRSAFSINLSSEDQNFSFTLSLPYMDGIEESKIELSKFLEFMFEKELLIIHPERINDISGLLVELNSKGYSGAWTYKDQFEISARGNVKPTWSNVFLPAEVHFSFNKNDYIRYGGYNEMCVIFDIALNEYFSDSDYYIRGLFVSQKITDLLSRLKVSDPTKITIPICADLAGFNNFSIHDVEFFDEDNNCIYLDNFDWYESEPNLGSNRVYLRIMDDQKCELYFEISKEIDEKYHIKIEQTLNEELVLVGME